VASLRFLASLAPYCTCIVPARRSNKVQYLLPYVTELSCQPTATMKHNKQGASMPWMKLWLVLAMLTRSVLASGKGNTAKKPVYRLSVRDSIMIAHSFSGEDFGPAQRLHGATYTVDVRFEARQLVERNNWVIDIGKASDMVSTVLADLNFRNLDEVFPGENSTTEFVCKAIWDGIAKQLPGVDSHVYRLCVELHESHKAWASYESDLWNCSL
jgi:6-pyruvoyltetrahydropterin/6-carboxytetrahydropterin synthase